MKISNSANKVRINSFTQNKIVNFTNSARDIAKTSIKEASREGGKVLESRRRTAQFTMHNAQFTIDSINKGLAFC